MKKILFFITILTGFILPSGSYAQNSFAPLGAEWWYTGNNWDYVFSPPGWIVNETWTDHVTVVADTSIQGISCRKLVAVRTKKNGSNPDSAFVALNAVYYLYDNTDTVFIFNEATNGFQALYVFNAVEGDTVYLKNSYSVASTDSNFCYVIDSVRMVAYDTAHLKTFYTRTIMNSDPLHTVNWGVSHYNPDAQQWINTGQYTERLGGTYGRTSGLFPAVTFQYTDGWVSTTFPSGYLSCYYDPVTNIKRSGQDCDAFADPYTSIEPVALSAFGIKVFPNPSNGSLTVSTLRPLQEMMDIRIADLSGKLCKTFRFPKNESLMNMDVRLLPNGIYFMKLATGGKHFYQKVIIHQ
jgi:hypothetical protein